MQTKPRFFVRVEKPSHRPRTIVRRVEKLNAAIAALNSTLARTVIVEGPRHA